MKHKCFHAFMIGTQKCDWMTTGTHNKQVFLWVGKGCMASNSIRQKINKTSARITMAISGVKDPR